MPNNDDMYESAREKLARATAVQAALGDGNYCGSTYTVENDGRTFEVVVVIQDKGRPTAHDFRAMAEAELKESNHKVDSLRAALRTEETLSEGWSERAQKAEALLQRTLDYFGESGMPEDLLADYKATRGFDV